MKILQQINLTAEERQSRLIKASKDYMGGKMTRSQFEEAERKYGTDYGSVTLELAGKYQLMPRLLKFISSCWHQDHKKNSAGA
ncbi:hypothetical protein H6G64_13495 [Calothrix sp. FACHB-156]|nr:hypothetical protein [Calothrix sp. FACHB-156]